MMDIRSHNRAAWDRHVERGDIPSPPAGRRDGSWRRTVLGVGGAGLTKCPWSAPKPRFHAYLVHVPLVFRTAMIADGVFEGDRLYQEE